MVVGTVAREATEEAGSGKVVVEKVEETVKEEATKEEAVS